MKIAQTPTAAAQAETKATWLTVWEAAELLEAVSEDELSAWRTLDQPPRILTQAENAPRTNARLHEVTEVRRWRSPALAARTARSEMK